MLPSRHAPVWLVGLVALFSLAAAAAERLELADDLSAPIEASLYSLPSSFFEVEESARFLTAVRRARPERRLLVLADAAQQRLLASRLETLAITWLPSGEHAFTPWPRDPLSFARTSTGAVRLLVRPNLQRGREADAAMGRTIVEGLPAELDRAWDGVGMVAAAVPFHNGHLLATPGVLWLSLHSLEGRILELLGEPRVPVASFATRVGVERYLAAAEHASAELGELWGRPARFVHPLPASGGDTERAALMVQIGGGAGFDLDSLLTFLPAPGGRLTALVADLDAGRELVERASPEELTVFRLGFDLSPTASELGARLAEGQQLPRAARLDRFLELVAAHLTTQGMTVARLPFLLVPSALLADQTGVSYPDFMVSWNNVVIETVDGKARAEGFSSLLASGDALARAAFTQAGAELELLPPLVHSVVLGGGYRCASNHLRSVVDPGPRRSS